MLVVTNKTPMEASPFLDRHLDRPHRPLTEYPRRHQTITKGMPMNSDLTAAYAASRRSDLLREAEAGRLAASVRQPRRQTKLAALTGQVWMRLLPETRRTRKRLVAVVDDRQVETCY